MARARNLKPGFFKNEELAELGPLAMLLFESLWCLADREGRLEDRPKRIKAETFPYFDADVDALLNALQSRGFLVRYEASSGQYIQIVNFTKHQTPHIKEAASTIPAPDEHQTNTVLAPPLTLNRIPDTGLSDCGVQGGSGADAPPKPKTRRATEVPVDWWPTPELVQWAVKKFSGGLGYEAIVDDETHNFVRHHRSKGNTFKDIGLAWQNWMAKAHEYGKARASPNGSRPEERRPSLPRIEDIMRPYEDRGVR